MLTSKGTIRWYRQWTSRTGAHQPVRHQALVVDMHAQVVRDVLAARVVQGLAVRASRRRAA
jgi:hypothetical protein